MTEISLSYFIRKLYKNWINSKYNNKIKTQKEKKALNNLHWEMYQNLLAKIRVVNKS